MSADADVAAVLGLRVWAVVGCSPDPARDSHRVARFLLDRGYDVVPVHPSGGERFGRPCLRSLAEVPPGRGVQVVDVFRRSDQAGIHVDEAIELGAEAVWLQLGVRDEAAAARARAAGLRVVMDRCPKIEWPRLARTG